MTSTADSEPNDGMRLFDVASIKKAKVADLRAWAAARNLEGAGKKPILANRLTSLVAVPRGDDHRHTRARKSQITGGGGMRWVQVRIPTAV